jgi:hypothetical protein
LVIRHAVSMKSIVKSALDAFSAAAGTSVSTPGGHPATVVRRVTVPDAISGPPAPDIAECSIFWAAIRACRSWVLPLSRYHRRAWVTSSTMWQTRLNSHLSVSSRATWGNPLLLVPASRRAISEMTSSLLEFTV